MFAALLVCLALGADSVSPVATQQDLYRPNYHFTAERNWINDPNGLLFYQGEYHLFFQHHPDGMQWGPMHWGHAVSKDLAHWQRLPIALYPDDLGMIFSGSAVADTGNTSGFFNGSASGGMVAIFTHSEKNPEAQSIAYSADRGLTWTKYVANPVIPNPGYKDFRDPKVFWYEPSHRWVMAVAGGPIKFYSSPNLREWTLEGGFEDNTECPDLFEVPLENNPKDKRWVLSLGGVSYYVGSFDGKSFKADGGKVPVDLGQDFYAAQSWNGIPASDSRAIWIGWMLAWQHAGDTPTWPWRGAMTVPRELTLRATPQGFCLFEVPPIFWTGG